MPARYSTLILNFTAINHVVKKISGRIYTCKTTLPTKQGTEIAYAVEMNVDTMAVKVTSNDLKELSVKQIRIVVNKAIDAICLKSGKHKDVAYKLFEVTYKAKGLSSDGILLGKEGQKQVKALTKAGRSGENKGRKKNDKRKAVTPPRRKRGTQPLPEPTGKIKKGGAKKLSAVKKAVKKAVKPVSKKVIAKKTVTVHKPIKIAKKTVKDTPKSFAGKKIKIKLSR